ncbi:hypothetical protein LK09_00050 [Microbacterium mangrovi]|uniref:Ribonuclease VapC n=1 Tax=Microbacterium mangrovi TaxID=1348253 RepID=A0A0B2AE03_9MICO|nr:hypothetical protein LK09_00050 [Microbacterium mangrovi]
MAYFDTSALVKRIVREAESEALADAVDARRGDGAQLVGSVIAKIELARVLLRQGAGAAEADRESRAALEGIAIAPMTDVVIEFARGIDPPILRSLDAIHLATAVAVGADEVWTYDSRLADAAAARGMLVRAPA